ncbi:MAG: hypothetical protein OHK93_008722 [Ramalina farinacea]|uniref:Uncharacterized protein n=1 Tax=Ramalina farinacea TaxID=258253 RepID=A0AA43QPP6_9LECA|nr:hypothetical protein [Ramalina farinacea]
MMVPRAYKYGSSPISSEIRQEKEPVRSKPDRKLSATSEKKEVGGKKRSQPSSALSPSPASPSKPVVIPSRTREDGARSRRDSAEKGGQNGSSSSNRPHDPGATPPSTAAFLAMTSIPEQARRLPTGTRPRPIERSPAQLQARKKSTRSISSTSPQTWDLLVTPPHDSNSESASFESDTTLGPYSSVRSISTESMPSLAEDVDSCDSASGPATPSFSSGNRFERKRPSLSTSLGEDCVFDHPLLPPPARDEDDSPEEEVEESPPAQSRRSLLSRQKTSFKSNLTASFRAIKSAARSISDLTGPLPQRDDLISRSVLSIDIPFTDERRPRPSLDPPDPALRRYLNPITLFPAELHFHSETEPLSCKSSIQLQAYRPGQRRSMNASSPPIFPSSKQQSKDDNNNNNRRKRRSTPSSSSSSSPTDLTTEPLDTEDTALTAPSSLQPRQREPRENSDFLRVIVLEMNMRKLGKLGEGSPGRARLWLPARQAAAAAAASTPTTTGGQSVVVVQNDEEVGQQRRRSDDGRTTGHYDEMRRGEKKVPRRWVGVGA